MAKKLDQSILKDSKASDIDDEHARIEAAMRLATLRKRRRRCCGCFFVVAFLALAALTLVDLMNK